MIFIFNFIFYIVFVALFYFCMFKLPAYCSYTKLIILYVGLMLGSVVIFILSPFVVYAYTKITNSQVDIVFIKQITAKLMMSLTLVVFFVNLFVVLIADNILNLLIGFHEKYNTENLDKNPVKFVIKNKDKIKLAYRIFYMLGACLGFYGIWFGK